MTWYSLRSTLSSSRPHPIKYRNISTSTQSNVTLPLTTWDLHQMEVPKPNQTSGVPMAILFLTVISGDSINQALRCITHRDNPPFIPSLFPDTFFMTTASSQLISHFRHSSSFPWGQQAHGLSPAIWQQFKWNLSLSCWLYYGGKTSLKNTVELRAGMCRRARMVWRFRCKSISKTPLCEGKTTCDIDCKGRQFTIF